MRSNPLRLRRLTVMCLSVSVAALAACSDSAASHAGGKKSLHASLKPLGDFDLGRDVNIIAARGSSTKNVMAAILDSDGSRTAVFLTIRDGEVSHRPLGFKIPVSMRVCSFSLDGSVIVGAAGFQAAAIRNGQPVLLPFPERDGSSSCAYGVSDDGRTIVGYCGFGLRREAVRWRDGKVESLGQLPGGMDIAEARWVSPDGQIILGQADGALGDSVVRLGQGPPKPLPGLTDTGSRCEVKAASATGQVVIGQCYVEKNERWVSYCMGPGMSTFKTIASAVAKPDSQSRIDLISGQGNRVFGWVFDVGHLMWSLDGGVTRLDEMLPEHKPDEEDPWEIWSVQATNADGTLLLVSGSSKSGLHQPCLVKLP